MGRRVNGRRRTIKFWCSALHSHKILHHPPNFHSLYPSMAAETEAPPLSHTLTSGNQIPPPITSTSRYKWWIQIILFSFFYLAGQASATLLSRLYFNNGGNTQWLLSLIQIAGFPFIIPFRWLKSPAVDQPPSIQASRPNKKFPILLVYIALGILTAAVTLLYTVGIHYLPVTTFILLTATQLGFNAFFSYFLNHQKFTPYIVNSLLLLTLSSVLLVFIPDQAPNAPSKKKHALGFLCTVAGSATFGLLLATTQLTFRKIIKRITFEAIIDLTVYQSLVASVMIGVGLFASGEWRNLHSEMKGYRHGTTSYVMSLVWMAICWQVSMVGCVGLIFSASALFSNVIGSLGTPLTPTLAVVFMGEKMNGLKGVSMVLAIWGFASYMYQHYLDDLEIKKTTMTVRNEGDDDADRRVEAMDRGGQANELSIYS